MASILYILERVNNLVLCGNFNIGSVLIGVFCFLFAVIYTDLDSVPLGKYV